MPRPTSPAFHSGSMAACATMRARRSTACPITTSPSLSTAFRFTGCPRCWSSRPAIRGGKRITPRAARGLRSGRQQHRGASVMSKEQENKAIVGRWFTEFWGNPWNPKVIDDLAAPDMLLQYSLHAPRRGREDVRDFITGFRKAFPDLGFGGAADLIAEGDYVVGRWIGGGTH